MRVSSAVLSALAGAFALSVYLCAARWGAQSIADTRAIGATLLAGRQLLQEENYSGDSWPVWVMVGYAALGVVLGLLLGASFALRRDGWRTACKRTAWATGGTFLLQLLVLACAQNHLVFLAALLCFVAALPVFFLAGWAGTKARRAWRARAAAAAAAAQALCRELASAKVTASSDADAGGGKERLVTVDLEASAPVPASLAASS